MAKPRTKKQPDTAPALPPDVTMASLLELVELYAKEMGEEASILLSRDTSGSGGGQAVVYKGAGSTTRGATEQEARNELAAILRTNLSAELDSVETKAGEIRSVLGRSYARDRLSK